MQKSNDFWLSPSVLWHWWLADRKGIRHVKGWVLVCWWWQFDWSFARLIAPVVTCTSIILRSNKIQNGDILVPANSGSRGKMAIKMERERVKGSYDVDSCKTSCSAAEQWNIFYKLYSSFDVFISVCSVARQCILKLLVQFSILYWML